MSNFQTTKYNSIVGSNNIIQGELLEIMNILNKCQFYNKKYENLFLKILSNIFKISLAIYDFKHYVDINCYEILFDEPMNCNIS